MGGFNFNDDEADIYDQVSDDVESPNNAQEVLDSLDAQEEELEDDLTEIEKRMEVAAYYNCLLKDSIFAGDPTHAARIVSHRIRKFVKQELSELVGLTAPQAQPPVQPLFTEAEIAALKALAAKVMGKSPIAEPVKRGPQLNSIVKPTAPTVPQLKPTIPTVKPVQLPQSQNKPAAPQKLVKKTQGKRGRKFVELPHPKKPGETIIKDVSQQAQPQGPIRPLPMPTGPALTMVTEHQAQQIATNPSLGNADRSGAEKASNQIAAAIQLSLRE